MSNGNQNDRPAEKPAVRTTIVGGRPPGSGREIGPIPRGMEILIQKAAVDPEFKELLLAKRAEAAREIELPLEPAEAAMLNAVPAEQLEAIIANTKVPEKARRALLGKVAGVTLAALGAAGIASVVWPPTRGSRPERPDGEPAVGAPMGIRPDRPPSSQPAADMPQADDQSEKPPAAPPQRPVVTRGISPDRPPKSRPHG